MADHTTEPPPVVCTLTPQELVTRGLEWSELADLALTSEPIDGGAASTYDLAIAEAIEDLAGREQSCCGSWLAIATTRLATSIRLELTTTNPDGLAVIERMSGLGGASAPDQL